MAGPARFIRIWLASLLGLAALVIGINLLVDPYEVFGTPRIAGISAYKPAAKNHSMLAKTYQIARVHPVTVLIGSSSTHIGIDAADPAWPLAMRPVYNYGIPGGYATSTSLSTLREAIALGGVRNAIVFLDFQNFFVPEQPAPQQPATSQGEDDRRFHWLANDARNPNREAQVADDMFLSLATMGALTDSVTTVISQRNPTLLNLAPDGSSTEADFINAARNDGMHDLFAQKDAFEAARARGLAQVMARWHGPLPNLGIVVDMMALAQTHDVKLTLVITPHHADALELYWRNGLWPRVEQLKTELAALAASKGRNVVLWDFMDYSRFSTEAVPPQGDRRTPMRWFWEPTHFKKQLGRIMIGRVIGAGAPDFGAVLTPETVAARNDAVRAQRQALVCGGDAAFLTSLDKPINNGCARVEQIAKQPS
ncbi:hypothetical protein [Rhodopila sp.]|uniref:hypothetical protein n=1 Tax=Rhodopila sp. TaxID=2480087 RepID=UPI003D1246CB